MPRARTAADADADADAPTATTRPSKTRLKQQSHELQKLGMALAELSDDRLAALDLPERLRDAIARVPPHHAPTKAGAARCSTWAS